MLEKNSNKFFNKLPRLFFISVVPTCKIYCKNIPFSYQPLSLCLVTSLLPTLHHPSPRKTTIISLVHVTPSLLIYHNPRSQKHHTDKLGGGLNTVKHRYLEVGGGGSLTKLYLGSEISESCLRFLYQQILLFILEYHTCVHQFKGTTCVILFGFSIFIGYLYTE